MPNSVWVNWYNGKEIKDGENHSVVLGSNQLKDTEIILYEYEDHKRK